MRIVRKWISRSRVRKARMRLSADPSPMTYANLAKEHAISGGVREALRICEEGLASFPGSSELTRLAERIRQRQRERRMRDLKRVLRDAPRPAVWQEMCEILLESGQIARAEEAGLDWRNATEDAEAQWMLARIRVERYLASRNRDEGLRAFNALDSTQAELPRDPRPLRLRMQLACQVGAWGEARRAAVQLLQIDPGDPNLEARFRTIEGRAIASPDLDAALRAVERSGVFVEDEGESERNAAPNRDVRPTLKSLATLPGIRAALYLRGGTALVQGPKGATAERCARSVRSIVKAGRTTARRLGLGQISEIQVESPRGGVLTVSAGELDAGAVWSGAKLPMSQRKILLDLAGLDAMVSPKGPNPSGGAAA